MMSCLARRRGGLVALFALLAVVIPAVAFGDAEVPVLVPGTGVLLDQSSATTSGGTGSTSSTSTMTNIFAPPAYVDYKRAGTEPVVTVDRYPYTSGTYRGQSCSMSAPCYKDAVYVDSTEGFGYPAYDFFWSSQNLGQSFHLAHNDPTLGGRAIAQGRGGGDGYQAVGDVSHKVFFIDLPATGVTMNVSSDGGETFAPDEFGAGLNSGFDDRQWDATDETASLGPSVYMNVNDDLDLAAPTIVLNRSLTDGALGSFIDAGQSPCNKASAIADNPTLGVGGAVADTKPTACPDPIDPTLSVAGPIVVDKSTVAGPSSHPHRLYIPFLRCTGDAETGGLVTCGAPYRLYIARSDDGGTTWTRRLVKLLGPTAYPRNIFVQMTVDKGGNLYYDWAQSQVDSSGTTSGETDIYYAYSTSGGDSWSSPINLTQETGDSAVFPWMVAGDPGQVDLVYYKANTGDYPPNATQAVWNVYFSQSQNALNPGPNFKSVQISDHPNHVGPICTSGLGCSGGRTLGDFFTMDIDHLGAANVVWADDNNSRRRAFIKFGRQLAGNSVFKNTPLTLMNDWPIHDHAAADPTGDTITPAAFAGTSPSCSSLDILKLESGRSGDLLSVNLTLAAPPTAVAAAVCDSTTAPNVPSVVDGGFWGAEWWSSAGTDAGGSTGNDNFYLAYIDQPGSMPRVEAGRLNRSSFPSLTGNEPRFVEPGTLGGTCTQPLAPSPCTLTLTASLSGLGIKSGAGLYSLSGEALYITGRASGVPFTNVEQGYTSLGDTTAAIDYNGTGTTP